MKDSEFQELVKQAADRIGANALADLLMVSRPTIQRWIEGRNLAHSIARESIKDFLMHLSP